MSTTVRADAAELKSAASPGLPAGRSLRMPQWLTGSGTIPFRRARGKSASWHVLKQRRFLIYFAVSLVSNLGTWLQNPAQMLLAYQLTHCAFPVSLLTSAPFSSFLVGGPCAGGLRDPPAS